MKALGMRLESWKMQKTHMGREIRGVEGAQKQEDI